MEADCMDQVFISVSGNVRRTRERGMQFGEGTKESRT